jgi:anion transporter
MTGDTTDSFSGASSLQYLSLLLAVSCLAYGLLAEPPTDLSARGFTALTVFNFGLALWQSKVVPYIVTSLLVIGLLFALGTVGSFQEATTGFASTLFFFFFSILVLGHAISKVGLDTLVAQQLLATSTTPRTSVRQLAKYVLALSFVMPSALARMVAFSPVVGEVADIYDLDRDDGFTTTSFLLLGQLNPIASMSLMTGGGLPIIGAQLIQTAGYPIDWIDWALYMIPPTLFVYSFAFVALERLYPATTGVVRSQPTDGGRDIVERQSMTREQRTVGVVMVATLVAWAVTPFLGVPTVLPAIVAVAVLAAPRVRVLGSDDLTEVSWGILFLIGTMFSLIEVLDATGAFDWLIGTVSGVVPFASFSTLTVAAVLLAFVVVMRMLFPSGSACLLVVIPIIVSFGQVYELNVLYLSFSAVLLVGSTVLIPLHIPPSLLAYNWGYVDTNEVLTYGLCNLVFAGVSVCLAWFVYWPFLESTLY